MPTITVSNNPSISHTFPGLLADEFLPVVRYKEPNKQKNVPENSDLKPTDVEVTLDKNIDEDKRTFNMLELTTTNKEIKLPFTIIKGSKKSSDDDGYIAVQLSNINGEKLKKNEQEGIKIKGIKLIKNIDGKEVEKIIEDFKFEASYKDKFNLELAFTLKETKEFYVDFSAYDNGEDWFDGDIHGDLENIFCGRVKVIFEVKQESKVGLRLTSNIESLPKAPVDYVEPPTWTDPKKSFEVANKYQNCYGMCFAVSMARVRKAFNDEFSVVVIETNVKKDDYLYSGTIINSIPDKYFGYGVGGFLASKGYAELVDEDAVWDGKLQEGAMLQYWYGDDLDKVKARIKARDENDLQSGHSVVFKSYTKDSNGNVTGFKYYDYSGINGICNKGDGRIFLGANLKDID